MVNSCSCSCQLLAKNTHHNAEQYDTPQVWGHATPLLISLRQIIERPVVFEIRYCDRVGF